MNMHIRKKERDLGFCLDKSFYFIQLLGTWNKGWKKAAFLFHHKSLNFIQIIKLVPTLCWSTLRQPSGQAAVDTNKVGLPGANCMVVGRQAGSHSRVWSRNRYRQFVVQITYPSHPCECVSMDIVAATRHAGRLLWEGAVLTRPHCQVVSGGMTLNWRFCCLASILNCWMLDDVAQW